MNRRAVIYTRMSKDRAGAGLGVDRQRQDCEELAERLGWQVVGHHSDNDLSAYSGKPRPGYKALLPTLRKAMPTPSSAGTQTACTAAPSSLSSTSPSASHAG